ncbi:MAG: hypothetical protein Q8O88_01885 [bacterium]|nr:hypothetical protein [bacterium]
MPHYRRDGLQDSQKAQIKLVMISYQSGNRSKDSLIHGIVTVLSGTKRLSTNQINDLETSAEDVGFTSQDTDELIPLVKRAHKNL